jgi:hypothetical protein
MLLRTFALSVFATLMPQLGDAFFAQPQWCQRADAQVEESSTAEWKSLFDGETLSGWKGAEGLWSVEDGAITGITTAEEPIKSNSFLIWSGGDIADFELKLKFKIESGNSGVQFRSDDLGDFAVAGYQADIDSEHRFTGINYEERKRGIIARRGQHLEIDAENTSKEIGKTCTEEEFRASIKDNDWNEYVITAVGNRITQTINGVKTVDLADNGPEAAATGIIAFQLHTGPPMKVQFKDIFLRDMSK